MKKIQKLDLEDQIDLIDIFKILYKKKLIILSFCFIGLLSSYLINSEFVNKKPQISMSEIQIDRVPKSILLLPSFLLPNNKMPSDKFIDLYNKKFIDLVLSKKNLQFYFDTYGKELINIIDLDQKFFKNNFFFTDYYQKQILQHSERDTKVVFRFYF